MRNNFGSFLLGALVGGAIGAAVALLYTPSSGMGIRDQVKKYFDTVKTEVNQAAENRRAELEQELASLRATEPRS